MRVSDKMGYNQVTSNLQRNRTDINDLQNQAASQKRLTKPSDDPIASAKVLANRTEDRNSNQFIKNITQARSFLEFTDQSLSELSETLVRLKELAIQQANDAGASTETRKVTSEEVAQTFNQIIQIGNRKLGERFIFGGHQTVKQPFDQQGNYRGDDGDLKIHVNKEAFVAMNLPGDRVFLGKGLGSDGLVRAREETPRDVEELNQFKGNELNRREHNKLIESGEGQTLLRAPASTQRGDKSVVRSDFDSDAQGISVLDAVKNFEIGLRVNDKGAIQDSIDGLDQAISQVIQARAQVGARIQTLTHTQDSLQRAVVDNKVNNSLLEDADLFQVVSDMSKADSTLKATMETSGKIIQPSLLDFLK
jgi:flagellar hook-associated protein 3 FlgL